MKKLIKKILAILGIKELPFLHTLHAKRLFDMKKLNITIKRIFISFGLLALYFILVLLFAKPLFSFDDRNVHNLAAGIHSYPTKFTLFNHIIFGVILKNLYDKLNYLWYDFLLIFSLYLSNSILFYTFIKIEFNFKRLVLFIFFITSVLILQINETIYFTIVASSLGITAFVLSFYILKNQWEKWHWLLVFFCMFFSVMIRIESFLLVILLSFSLFFYGIYAQLLSLKPLLFFYGIVLVFFTGLYFFQSWYYSIQNQNIKDMILYQKNRVLIYDYDIAPYKPYENIYKNINWTQNDRDMIAHGLYYADSHIFNSNNIQKIVKNIDIFSIKHIKLRGIKEIPIRFGRIIQENIILILSILALVVAFPNRKFLIVFFLFMVYIFSLYIYLMLFMKTSGYVDYSIFLFLSIFVLFLVDTNKKYIFFSMFVLSLLSLYNLRTTNWFKKDDLAENKILLLENLEKDKLYYFTALAIEYPYAYGVFEDMNKYKSQNLHLLHVTPQPNLVKFGIKNALRDIIDHPKAVWIIGSQAHIIESYIRYIKQHYGKDVKFELLKRVGVYNFFIVRSY